jgi:hypothetical protein
MCEGEEQFLDGCMIRILGRYQLWSSLRGERKRERGEEMTRRGERRGEMKEKRVEMRLEMRGKCKTKRRDGIRGKVFGFVDQMQVSVSR